MAKTFEILEHEILEALYIRTSLIASGYTRGDGKTVMLVKRDYDKSTLHFGTLAGVVNNPDKYEGHKALQGLDLVWEEIEMGKYNPVRISNAIEVLEFNGHVIDKVVEKTSTQSGSRKITLTQKGAIDYRDNFYFKEYESKASIIRGYEIQKKDKWLKKYWIVVEISKYIMGGVIGAMATIGIGQLSKSGESKSGMQAIGRGLDAVRANTLVRAVAPIVPVPDTSAKFK